MSGSCCPVPMPTTPCIPASAPTITRLSDGSTHTTWQSAFFSLRYRAQPLSVPPVPAPATKASHTPPVCSQISGAVVVRCASGLSSLSNWYGVQ